MWGTGICDYDIGLCIFEFDILRSVSDCEANIAFHVVRDAFYSSFGCTICNRLKYDVAVKALEVVKRTGIKNCCLVPSF